ncbi:hypothetical protein [Kitasatospora sp. A2-31]|uniref:hypothetical protein n=1 Tax=Kitasatospora sp. A2-31 TaxID=2916414 RepID=UPI001EEC8781|nr:hypothetical protein [Kitasatospora sp. A2-31]MCG6494818.1 hypothetical protein [Kitasatospora sp. A2-31]
MSAPENVPPAAVPATVEASDTQAVPAVPAEPAAMPVPAEPAAAARRLPRAAGVALATAGLLAVTATSAVVTVAVGKPDPRPAAAAAPAAAPATATSSPSASAPAAAPSAPSAVPTTAPPAPEPKPTSTVRGTVKGGKHEGDLRYFLLPIPDGGESYGPVDGMTMDDDAVADIFGKQDGIMRILGSYGYRDAATRTYRTADGKAEVTVTLMRFATTGGASDFAKNHTMKLDPIDIDGDPAAHGYLDRPKQQAYTGSMAGISSQGDVQYTVDVDVKGTPDKALLSELMKRQREWLSNGG